MKKLLASTALALSLLATPALADPVTVFSTGTPDAAGFSAGTVNGYSYYAGPLQLNTDLGTLIAFCLDLNHSLTGGVYDLAGNPTQNGLGGSLDALHQSQIAAVASFGFAAFATNTVAGNEAAAAAQLMIWSIAYDTSATGLSAAVADDYLFLQANLNSLAPGQGITMMTPQGSPGWPGNLALSQGLVTQVAAVPEASTWAMLLLGFAGVGAMGMKQSGRKFRFA